MNWAEMSPEQKDNLIAEKIMDWQPMICTATHPHIYVNSEHQVLCKKCGYTEDEVYLSKLHTHVYWKHATPMPRYTESMDAAWQVLRRMAEQEFEELHSAFAYRLGVTFATQEGFDTFAANLDQLASWTPEKICLAALKATGMLDEQGNVREA